jgi:hypothetical protein
MKKRPVALIRRVQILKHSQQGRTVKTRSLFFTSVHGNLYGEFVGIDGVQHGTMVKGVTS